MPSERSRSFWSRPCQRISPTELSSRKKRPFSQAFLYLLLTSRCIWLIIYLVETYAHHLVSLIEAWCKPSCSSFCQSAQTLRVVVLPLYLASVSLPWSERFPTLAFLWQASSSMPSFIYWALSFRGFLMIVLVEGWPVGRWGVVALLAGSFQEFPPLPHLSQASIDYRCGYHGR